MSNQNGTEPKWDKVIRALQGSCKYNSGFAVITLRIVVNHNSPVLWGDPDVTRLHPAAMASVQMTPALAACLTAMLE